MSNGVTLSLPLSATALRLGATLLTDLAAQADSIYAELTGANPFYRPADLQAAAIAEGILSAETDPLVPLEDVREKFEARRDERLTTETTLEQDVQIAEAAAVNPYSNETPEERQFRLHGNVASAGMEPAPVITQETLPSVEYETIVVGYEDGPTVYAEGHNRESYEKAGWSVADLLKAGHLVEVTEQRPKVDVRGACDVPSAPAPAPAPSAPNGSIELDIDGLPYDARIHSDATVRKAATGKWKTRRNLAEGYKEQIEAELRQVMNAGKSTATEATVASTVGTASAPASTAPAPTTTTVVVAAPPAPSAAPAPAPSPAPVAPVAAPAGNQFAEFTRWLVGHTKAGKLSQTDAVLEIQKQGLTQIPDLAKRPDLIPAVMAALTAAKGL